MLGTARQSIASILVNPAPFGGRTLNLISEYQTGGQMVRRPRRTPQPPRTVELTGHTIIISRRRR